MSTKAEYAISLHDKGYNCAQAVACTFCKEFGVDEQEMFKIAEGFGLGMGMMEMCGALSSSFKKSAFLCLVAVVSFSFFISNMMEMYSRPFSS